MTISSRLREYATSKGLTLAEVSRRAGVSYATVWSAARGAVPGAMSRQRIADALQLAPNDLWPDGGATNG